VINRIHIPHLLAYTQFKLLLLLLHTFRRVGETENQPIFIYTNLFLTNLSSFLYRKVPNVFLYRKVLRAVKQEAISIDFVSIGY
jgi:hypothetical protein